MPHYIGSIRLLDKLQTVAVTAPDIHQAFDKAKAHFGGVLGVSVARTDECERRACADCPLGHRRDSC
jgi:hypothetical protein